MTALAGYPYLCFALILLAGAGLGLALLPHQRRPMLFCGFGAAPTALLTLSFVPAYWQPARVGDFIIGLEDAIFPFSTGCLMWLLFAGFTSTRFDLRIEPRRFLRRYCTCGPIFVALYYVLRRLDLQPMPAALAGMVILAAGVGALTREYSTRAIAGGTKFCALYSVMLAAAFVAWPGFPRQWTSPALSGLTIGVVPIDEMAWAFVAGTAYPLVMAFVLDARPREAPIIEPLFARQREPAEAVAPVLSRFDG